MPVITVSKKEIENVLSKSIELAQLEQLLFDYLKGDIENVQGDELSIEFKDSNRPDLWSSEGIGRELRTILRLQKGFSQYDAKDSDYQVTVDSNKVHPIRSEIACAVVKNLKLTDSDIKSLMHIQDKLDGNYGRKRKKTSIGVYDVDKIKFPVIYTTVHPDSVKFVPLGFSSPMTPKEILSEHPKGKEYGHIIDIFKEYPILIDSENNILSLPPVINSNHLGKVETTTKNVLVEVTGTDKKAVNLVLSLVASALAERGGKVYSVIIFDKSTSKKTCTPDFSSLEFTLKVSEVRKRSGMQMDSKVIRNCLEKMSYEVLKIDENNDLIEVHAPFYRKDIMHPVDIIEDIIIGYGYNNIEPQMPTVLTIGSLLPSTQKEEIIKDIMIGMGAQEISSFTLASKELVMDKCSYSSENIVEIQNPISSSWNIMRPSLLPIMLNFLVTNKTVEFPQRIFEIGDVFLKDSSSETQVSQKRNICTAVTHAKANYNDIKSILDKLASDLDVKFKVEDSMHPLFIPGRCGKVIIHNKEVGFIGEISPHSLEKFGFENPVAIFEITIDLF